MDSVILRFRFGGAALLFAWQCLIPSSVQAQEVITYSYDGRGRVVQVDHSGSANAGVSSAYAYDDADNRTNVTVTGAMAGLAAPETTKVASVVSIPSGVVSDPAVPVDPVLADGGATEVPSPEEATLESATPEL